MIFRTKQNCNRYANESLDFYINNTKIEKTTQTKDLEMT